jgi:hypothetical protein
VNLGEGVGLGRENRGLGRVVSGIGGLRGGEMIGRSCLVSGQSVSWDGDVLGGF